MPGAAVTRLGGHVPPRSASGIFARGCHRLRLVGLQHSATQRLLDAPIPRPNDDDRAERGDGSSACFARANIAI